MSGYMLNTGGSVLQLQGACLWTIIIIGGSLFRIELKRCSDTHGSNE